MTASKSRIARGHTEDSEITARPRPLSDEISGASVESGLSVDPEDLGAHFLNEATGHSNFRSLLDSDVSELSIVSGAPSDAALVGPNFESDHTVWEQTVDITLQNDGLDALGTSVVDDHDPTFAADDATTPTMETASLFDQPNRVSGEIMQPTAAIDDNGHHTHHAFSTPLGPRSDLRASPGQPKHSGRIMGGAQSALHSAASGLRRLANKLEGKPTG